MGFILAQIQQITLDGGVRLMELVAIVFWIGFTFNDIKWIKDELKHLRIVVEDKLKQK